MTFVPTLCILHMLSDASETMTQVFGVEIPKRETWKRPKIGFSSSEVQEMKTPIEPVMVYASMKGSSPSFVANEARSEVYLPAMGAYRKKYDKITNGLDAGILN